VVHPIALPAEGISQPSQAAADPRRPPHWVASDLICEQLFQGHGDAWLPLLNAESAAATRPGLAALLVHADDPTVMEIAYHVGHSARITTDDRSDLGRAVPCGTRKQNLASPHGHPLGRAAPNLQLSNLAPSQRAESQSPPHVVSPLRNHDGQSRRRLCASGHRRR